MIHTMFNKLLVKGNKLCRTCCLTEFECNYNLVNFGLSCWPAGQAPDHLIVQFHNVRRCCDDTLIEELNTKFCLYWNQFNQTYFGCVVGVDIDGTDYNLIIGFGDGATNLVADIFVLMKEASCVFSWPYDGAIFHRNAAGIICPPITLLNAFLIGNCGGAGLGTTIKGYGGYITAIDPSGAL